MARASVSIVIPVYNGAAFLADALASLFRQTRLPDEIIVVDDRSTDHSVAVANEIAAAAPVPVRVIELSTNSGGPAHPINVGVREARGDIIGVLDQDDVLLPGTLALHCDALQWAPRAGVSCTLSAYLHDPQQLLQPPERIATIRAAGTVDGERVAITGDHALRLLLRHNNFVRGFPGFVFRRDLWNRCGPVRETLRIGGDSDILCSFAAAADMVCTLRPGYLRREHGGNMCDDTPGIMADKLQVLLNWLDVRPEFARDADVAANVRRTLLRVVRPLRRSGRPGGLALCIRAARRIGLDRQLLAEAAKQAVSGAARSVGAHRAVQTLGRRLAGRTAAHHAEPSIPAAGNTT